MIHYTEKQLEYRKKCRGENPNFKKINKKEMNKEAAKKSRIRLLELKIKAGGKCKICGYKEHPEILIFHHLKEKKFEIGKEYWRSKKRLQKEIEKCILICPNCHTLIHKGIFKFPPL